MRYWAAKALEFNSDPRAAGKFLEILNDRKRVNNIREIAVSVLGKLKYQPAKDVLVEVLAESRGEMKIHCIKALGQLGDVSAVAVLNPCLQDPDRHVKEAAREAIINIGMAPPALTPHPVTPLVPSAIQTSL